MNVEAPWRVYDHQVVPVVEPYLTPAELEVLRARANGLSTKMTAVVLGKTVGTVKSQLHNASERFGARNTAHLMLLALRSGVDLS